MGRISHRGSKILSLEDDIRAISTSLIPQLVASCFGAVRRPPDAKLQHCIAAHHSIFAALQPCIAAMQCSFRKVQTIFAAMQTKSASMSTAFGRNWFALLRF